MENHRGESGYMMKSQVFVVVAFALLHHLEE
jgi:hypothetical protein